MFIFRSKIFREAFSFTLILLLFFSPSFGQPLPLVKEIPLRDFILKGTILDAVTKFPICGAVIKASAVNIFSPVVSVVSDSKGAYVLNLNLEKLSSPGTSLVIHVTCLRKGYIIKNNLLRFNKLLFPRNPYLLDIYLTPVEKQKSPVINSITPVDNSVILAGAKIDIQVSAQSPKNNPLEYQFSIGGVVKQPWSSLNVCTWQTQVSDTATVEVNCEVRDNKSGQASKLITYSIINPAPEEVFKKVADNYAKIYDMKADMILSSTLNGKPFGETEYCRYFFMAPNKEKTESFSDSSRVIKTEVNIINGSMMYLVDVIKKLTQSVDLLTESGINNAQFNQMDIYYNQENFLNNHILTRNDNNSDLNNFIIAFDAVPKAINNLYTKLILFVNYDKGLLVKSYMYKENESKELALLQTLEVAENQRMPSGVWIPKKINRILMLKSGNLIETAGYDNLQTNTGLTDSDFNPEK